MTRQKPQNLQTSELFVVTEDWYFISHRLAFAKYLKTIGYDVAVATRVNSCADVIISSGIELFSLKLKRQFKPDNRDPGSD